MTDLNEWINERRNIHNAATPGPWDDSGGGEIDQHWSCPTPYREVVSTDVSCMSFCYGGTSRGVLEDEDSAAIVDAHNTLPALLTAVEKVLELHKPVSTPLVQLCSVCAEETDCAYALPWPCPTVKAVQSAIEGAIKDEQ